MYSLFKHKNLFVWICGIGILILFISSCNKFVQIAPPATQLVTASVFSNSASATAAQISIYVQMVNSDESANIAQNSGILGDELASHSSQPAQVELYTNALLPNNDEGRWSSGYKYIYQANAIIEALQNNGNITSPVRQQLTGESKFLRAFWHFYLTNMYGDIPLILTTDYSINERISRTPRAQVYTQIIKDLNDAAQLLNASYIDGTDTAVTSDRVRPTKWAAYAMLARAYLYSGKYDSAAAAASLVINNSNYQLCTNLSPLMGPNSVFLSNSTEAIWQLSIPLPATSNTADAQYFVLTSAPGTGTLRSTTISTQLLNSFDSGDLRKSNWIGVYKTTKSPFISYYFPYKYQNTTKSITEYVMVLRLAEQYLIRAEAEAQMNNLTDAINDLNVIRNRAGLPNTSATTQADLLTAILHERQVELFTEWGHRWFDMIRTGTIDNIMGGLTGVCHTKGGSWLSTDSLYPISASEITNDPNLAQNSGY